MSPYPYVRDCLQTAEVHLSAEQQGRAAAVILRMGCANGGGRECLWAFARELGDEGCASLLRVLGAENTKPEREPCTH